MGNWDCDKDFEFNLVTNVIKWQPTKLTKIPCNTYTYKLLLSTFYFKTCYTSLHLFGQKRLLWKDPYEVLSL